MLTVFQALIIVIVSNYYILGCMQLTLMDVSSLIMILMLGVPYFEDQQQSSVYSCLSSTINNDTNVHIIGVYEAGLSHSFNYHPTYISNVCLNVNGSLLDKPLILVLTTYEPVHWVLHMPEGVVINKVILVTHHCPTHLVLCPLLLEHTEQINGQ